MAAVIHKQNQRKLPKRERDYRRQLERLRKWYSLTHRRGWESTHTHTEELTDWQTVSDLELAREFAAWETVSDEALNIVEYKAAEYIPCGTDAAVSVPIPRQLCISSEE